MQDPHARRGEQRHASISRGLVPPLVALAVAGPLLLAVAGLATVVIAGSALGALVLPALFGKRRASSGEADPSAIELGPDEYRRIDPDRPHLPRR